MCENSALALLYEKLGQVRKMAATHIIEGKRLKGRRNSDPDTEGLTPT
jgi:hypothetical protein